MRVGDAVVCIRRRAWQKQADLQRLGNMFPYYMQLLTIRSVEIKPDGVYFTFEEIENPDEFDELKFHRKDFRPVDMQRLTFDLAATLKKQSRPRKETLEPIKYGNRKH